MAQKKQYKPKPNSIKIKGDERVLSNEVFQLRQMLDSVPGDVYWKDVDGIWRGLNQRCAESLFKMGFIKKPDPLEVIGKTDYEIFDKQTADGYRKNDQEVMNKRIEITRKESTQLPNGKFVMLLSTKKPFLDDNNQLLGMIGNTVDITHEYQFEQKAKKSEAKALIAMAKAKSEEEMRKTVMVLVGDIVHDLRTPIATIRTANSLLTEMLPVVSEILKKAKSSGSETANSINQRKLKPFTNNRLTLLISQAISTMDDFINTALLDLGNAQKTIDEGTKQTHLIKCSSRRIIENTLEAYALDKNIEIIQDTTYDFFLMGNSILIMKILFNLIRNASEQVEMNKGGKIFLTTEEQIHCNAIKIKDTAGGVPKKIENKLFEDYFTTKENGTGLGLASAKRIMVSFGGKLTFENVPGKSIEFALLFPKIK